MYVLTSPKQKESYQPNLNIDEAKLKIKTEQMKMYLITILVTQSWILEIFFYLVYITVPIKMAVPPISSYTTRRPPYKLTFSS